MATRINVNVSGFDAAGLRERAQQDVLANRKAQEERTQRIKTTKEAITEREESGITDNAYGNLDGGKYRPKGLPEEYVPRRNPMGIGHVWLRPAGNNGSIVETLTIGESVNWLPAGYYVFIGTTPDPYNPGFSLDVYQPVENNPLDPFITFFESQFTYAVYRTITRLDVRRSCIKDFLTQNGVNTITLQEEYTEDSQSTQTPSIILPAGRDSYYLIALLQTHSTSETEVIKEIHGASGAIPAVPPTNGSSVSFRVDYSREFSYLRESKIFKCNKRIATSVDMPQKLIPIVDKLNPQPVSETLLSFGYEAEIVPVELPPGSPSQGAFVEAAISSTPKNIPYARMILPEPIGINNSTPEAFSLLNQLAVDNGLEPPINPSLLKTYEKPPLQLSKTTEQDQFTTFSFKKGDKELPRLQYRFPSEYRTGRSYYTVWDWDDPAYCRQILSTIELG